MKKLLSLASLIVFFSCQEQVKEAAAAGNDTAADSVMKQEEQQPVYEPGDIRGMYVGGFVARQYKEEKKPVMENRINISIDRLERDSIFGHSVVAGNNRPFKGTFTLEKGIYTISVKEPGDDKYDGEFSFSSNPDASQVEGMWNAYDKNATVTSRSFTLKKMVFAYDPGNTITDSDIGPIGEAISHETIESENETFDRSTYEMITPNAFKFNASVDTLTDEDISNFYKGDLEVMRNLVYARHGYSFKNRKMRQVFDGWVSWYIPVTTDVRNALTPLEKQNIALLKRYEEHAGRYYDSFGR